MAVHTIAAGEIAVHNKVLAANVVDAVNFAVDPSAIAIESSGTAAIYFTTDGSTPTVGGATTRVVPAASSATRRLVRHSGGQSVRLVSTGTPTYSVVVVSDQDLGEQYMADEIAALKASAGSSSGHVIEEEDTPLAQRANLNFTGAGVTAADSGGKTVVTIPGGGGGTASSDSVQAGVLGTGQGKVTRNSSSEVAVAAGSGWVPNASGVLTRATWTATTVTAIPVATDTRLDQVVVDSAGVISRLAGTDQAGVTLDNRTGAAALGNNVRLADLLVTTTGIAVTTGLRDRRPKALGAYFRIVRTSNAGGTNDYAIAVSANVSTQIDAVNINPRIECSGKNIRCSIHGRAWSSTATALFAPFVDGARQLADEPFGILATTTDTMELYISYAIAVSAGSHTLGWGFRYGTAATLNIRARAAIPFVVSFEEIMRDSESND